MIFRSIQIDTTTYERQPWSGQWPRLRIRSQSWFTRIHLLWSVSFKFWSWSDHATHPASVPPSRAMPPHPIAPSAHGHQTRDHSPSPIGRVSIDQNDQWSIPPGCWWSRPDSRAARPLCRWFRFCAIGSERSNRRKPDSPRANWNWTVIIDQAGVIDLIRSNRFSEHWSQRRPSTFWRHRHWPVPTSHSGVSDLR